MRLLTLVVVCLVASEWGHAYPSGAPKSACGNLKPSHAEPPPKVINKIDSYALAATISSYFLPGKTFRVRLTQNPQANTVNTQFKGILLRGVVKNNGANDDTAKDYGEWVLPGNEKNLQYRSCGKGRKKTHITHTNNDNKNLTDFTFAWKAPADLCDNTKEYFIWATVVWEKLSYQTGIQLRVFCQDVCEKGAKAAVLPIGISMNFESPAKIFGDNWRNVYTDPACMFTFAENSGTLSANTGVQYIRHRPFVSTPAFPHRYVAVLRSPYSLQGCYCFTFYCRMMSNKAKGGSVELTLLANGGLVMMDTMAEGPNWIKSQFSMVSSVEKVTMEFTSVVKDGEVHLDDFSVTAGLCNADDDENIVYIN